jgi:hypothetical protein
MKYKKTQHLECVNCGELCGEPRLVDVLYCGECEEYFTTYGEESHTLFNHSTPCRKCTQCLGGHPFLCEHLIVDEGIKWLN